MLIPEFGLETAVSLPMAGLPTLLIVANPSTLNIARDALIELELGWEVVFANSAFDAHDVPAIRRMDVILVDLGNPHIEGPELVESLALMFPQTPIVLMSAPYAVSVALEGMRKGAVNHFPRELLDREPSAVIETLRSAALDHQRRRTVNARLDSSFFQFTLGNDLREVPAFVQRLKDATIETGVCDWCVGRRVGVAIEECLLNAIVHGNLELSSELRQCDEAGYYRQIEERRTLSPFSNRKVNLTARISTDEAIFVVQDEGPGFDIHAVPDATDPANINCIGGRGILLMRAFMNDVRFDGCGNRVTMVKRRK